MMKPESFQSTFGEDPQARISRIDSIVNRATKLKTNELLVEHSTGLLVRTLEKVAIKRAAALLVGSLLIPAACGDQLTGGEPTVTTTIPATSTTEIQTTTTTEAPTTTTTDAETTTTTEAKDITKASGHVFDGVRRLKELGYVYSTDFPGNDIYDYVMLVIPTALNLKTTDFQGEQKEVYTIEVSLG